MDATVSEPWQAATARSRPLNDQRLVDRIICLAELASVQSDIDSMLDTMRLITARTSPEQPFNDTDRAALLALEQSLKDYLLHKDPLRAFNPQSLEQRLQMTAKEKTGKRTYLDNAFAVTLLSMGVALLPLAIPPYSSALSKLSLFSVPLFFLALAIGTARLYLSALADFKPELRKAFVLLCSGVAILGVAFSHYAIIQAFNLDRYPLFQYSGLTWLVTFAFILIYFGLRTYTRLLQVATIFASVWLAAAAVAGGIALAMLIPPSTGVTHRGFFIFSLSGIIVLAAMTGLGAGIARSILRSVTHAYAASMRWLYVYLLAGCLGSIGSAAALAWLGQIHGPVLNVVIIACGIGPQIILLYTGYSFKKETGQ